MLISVSEEIGMRPHWLPSSLSHETIELTEGEYNYLLPVAAAKPCLHRRSNRCFMTVDRAQKADLNQRLEGYYW